MGNIHSASKQVVSALSAGVTLAASTQTGTFINCTGYQNCKVIFVTTTGLTTTSNFTISESADGSTGVVAVAGATLAAAVLASQTNQIYVGDINLKKRLAWLRADVVGTGTNGNAYVIFELYNASDMSVTQTNAVAFAI